MFEDVIYDLIFKLLKGIPLTNPGSVYIKLFSNEIDITNTLFGINQLTLPANYWTTSTFNEIQNVLNLDFGTAISSFSGLLQFKFYSLSTNINFITIENTLDILNGNSFIIYSGGLSFSLTENYDAVCNFILNYFFKQILITPTNWYLNISDNLDRKQLNKNSFSNVQLNEVGYYSFKYGEYFTINSILDISTTTLSIYDSSVAGNKWFDFLPLNKINIYKDKTTEFFNNSLVLLLNKYSILGTFLLPKNTNSVLHLKFDGDLIDYSSNAKYNVLGSVSYTSTLKLFNTSSAIFDSSCSVTYNNVQIPNIFTLQLFVLFQTNPTNRAITFINKNNVLKIYKTNSNLFEISFNNIIVFSSLWIPIINTWYHIYISKLTNTGAHIVIGTDINVYISFPSLNLNLDNSGLKINDTSSPILGCVNGLDISSGFLEFVDNQQPLSKKPYQWLYIDNFTYQNLQFEQWKEYV